MHLLLSIPPKYSISSFMGYLKGKSALLIFQRWGNMKFAYRNREFWCKGYYVDTAGKNTKAIKEYIANQLKQDKERDQLSFLTRRTHLWVISNSCMAGRPIKDALVRCQYRLGLCPKMKYPPFYGGIFIYAFLQETAAKRTKCPKRFSP